MNRLNNERGAALVVVLGIIMLLMIFATVLAGQMANTQKQINLTDRKIDARNLARMGLDRAGKEVEKAYNTYKEEIEKNRSRSDKEKRTEEDIWRDFQKNIKPANLVTNIIRLDDSHFYKVNSVSEPTPFGTNQNIWEVKLTSEGYAYDKSITETSKIKIERSSASQ